jgi:glycosyltransferase involved in cell wall biosynthesis
MNALENPQANPSRSRLEGGLLVNGAGGRPAGGNAPVVSVITAVRNGGKVLEKTIESVLRQTYKPIEYIVVDGASTDETLDVIRRYDDRIAYWVSERDNGISDAFNKGIRVATGEFIALVNADDWMSDDQVATGVAALQASQADYAFGDLLLHDADGRVLYRIKGDPDYTRIIRSKMPEVNHPTVLARKSTYDRVGLFDLGYRYAMDYEWVLRVHAQGGTGLYVPGIAGHMGLGGASDASFRKAVKEVRDIAVRYGRSRMVAEIEYRYRVIKGTGRRYLERALPQSLFDRLRTLFNPRYAGKVK